MEENNSSVVAEQNEPTQPGTDQQEQQLNSEALQTQKNELQDRLLRLQAEFDNYRKRTDRERMEFAEYAGEQTVRQLLPVLDDLERALKSAAESAAGPADDFVKGVELIYSRLLETLKKQGLEPISTEGAQFDPHVHEAIQRTESQDHEDGAILAEFQRGYKFKGRLLRPAMVQVATGR
jgi:molecular chaperone GrpE